MTIDAELQRLLAHIDRTLAKLPVRELDHDVWVCTCDRCRSWWRDKLADEAHDMRRERT